MSHETPEINEIEAALAAWTPRAPQIDRDRLMFAAGRASASTKSLAPTLTLPLGGRESSPLPPRGRAGEGVAQSPVPRYFWPLATGLSTAAALFLAFQLATQQPAAHVEHIASDPPAEPVQIASSLPPNTPALDRRISLPDLADGTYLALRNRMLTTPADQWRFYRTLKDDARPGRAAVEDDDSAVEDDAARRAPTSRNLLRELLPPKSDRTPGDTDAPAAQSIAPHEALT